MAAQKNNSVSILQGELRGNTGKLLGIDGRDGIVKMGQCLTCPSSLSVCIRSSYRIHYLSLSLSLYIIMEEVVVGRDDVVKMGACVY